MPYDPATALLGVYSEKAVNKEDTCIALYTWSVVSEVLHRV